MAFSLRDHVKALLGVVLGLATILGAIAVVVPGIRDAMQRSGVAGWMAALLFCALWLAGLIVADARHASAEGKLRDLTSAIAEDKQSHMREMQDLRAAQAKEREEIGATKDAEIADLRARLSPTERDVDQFQELLELLPSDRGAMGWLEFRFNAKQWTAEDFEGLAEVQGAWRNRFFDDGDVQQAWARLRDAISDLTGWMAVNASPDPELNKYQPPEASTIYSVADGDERVGGWPAFDRLRDEGMNLASEVLDARGQFERVGRRRGL